MALDGQPDVARRFQCSIRLVSFSFPVTNEISLIAAFMTGLLGSLHCVGMCGGIVGALSMGLSARTRGSLWRLFPYQLLYNSGRILSYVIAGGLLAWLSSETTSQFGQSGNYIGKWLSGLFMVALGFYIAGWWQVLTILERAGNHVWRYVQPLGQRFLPVTNPFQAFGLGLVWGWLPCGMVYAMLAFALSSQDAMQGALIMLAFGLGTLPMLVLMGSAASRLGNFVRRPLVRQLAGTLILLFGLYTLFAPAAHDHHNHNEMDSGKETQPTGQAEHRCGSGH